MTQIVSVYVNLDFLKRGRLSSMITFTLLFLLHGALNRYSIKERVDTDAK